MGKHKTMFKRVKDIRFEVVVDDVKDGIQFSLNLVFKTLNQAKEQVQQIRREFPTIRPMAVMREVKERGQWFYDKIVWKEKS